MTVIINCCGDAHAHDRRLRRRWHLRRQAPAGRGPRDRHELPADCLSNVDGESNYVRVQVLTNSGALDRGKQLAVVRQLTDIIAKAAGDPALAGRTWVLLTEAPQGGWGLSGHANTNDELVSAARAQIAELTKHTPPS